MNYSQNYSFRKPEINEQYNLNDWNYNTDEIDNRIKINQTKSETNENNIATLTLSKADKSIYGDNSISLGRSELYDVGDNSVAIGVNATATKSYSFAQGYNVHADGDYQHVQGKYNEIDDSKAHIIGGGYSENNRLNIHTVDWNGNAYYAGTVKASEPVDNDDLTTKTSVINLIKQISVPVGYIYTQYPLQLSPLELFGFGTWENISSLYDSMFMRIEGEKTAEFGVGSQGAELPNVRGSTSTLFYFISEGVTKRGAMAGSYYDSSNHRYTGSGGYSSGSATPTMNLSQGQTNADGTTYVAEENAVYKDGGEVRPENITIRIWKRIA